MRRHCASVAWCDAWQGAASCGEVRDNREMKPQTDSRSDSSFDRPEIEPAALPPGWVCVTPEAVDAADLHALLNRHEVGARGRSSTTRAVVDADPSATGMQTHRNLVIR